MQHVDKFLEDLLLVSSKHTYHTVFLSKLKALKSEHNFQFFNYHTFEIRLNNVTLLYYTNDTK